MVLQQSRIELELPCALTDEEVQSCGRMLGETVSQIDDTQETRTATMKEFKERLVGLNETQRKLARIIRNRVENRMVMCVVQFHTPAEGIKRIVRGDTGEVVDERTMTDSEKQMNLFAAQKDFEEFVKGNGIGSTVDPLPDKELPGEKADGGDAEADEQ